MSGAMNMLGNLGAAMSAILFPWFVHHVTLPRIAPTTGTANSFFVFAAALNIAAAAAWMMMDPERKLDDNASSSSALGRTASVCPVDRPGSCRVAVYEVLHVSIFMIAESEYRQAQQRAAQMIRDAGVVITKDEADAVEVVDFGLSRLNVEGVQVLTLLATERVSAKVLALFPSQTEPEHWHPPVNDDPGKEETLRVISGEVFVFVPGNGGLCRGWVPAGKDDVYTARHEIVLKPGDQITLPPGAKHWFQAPDSGAVLYSFSTCVRDGLDRFSDPAVRRTTQIVNDEVE